ncbi:TetR/AcrR family transcriptional regulator [Williamsia sp.]|uniref:TetR/AcrR family transcriptional regulator n=1 Tax=Williamsia sp. TaxID=1872085 RepID=UPI0025D03FB9|nr:TetR/AcrR family transcriptional regulator [Williamsia sp.]
MTRQERYDQLMSHSWSIVREQGVDALTLGRLAEVAGITKPVVYSHFPSRGVLLVALYEQYDARQAALLEESLVDVDGSLGAHARAIATSYVDCVLGEGLAGVAAALEGTPDLAALKRRSDEAYFEQCRDILAPFADGNVIPSASMVAAFGAAEALSSAALDGRLARADALEELTATIVSTVDRCRS